MGYEYYVKFKDEDWYRNNVQKIEVYITRLPSFVKKIGSHEFWLRDELSKGTWEYDIRIFLSKELLIEVSMSGLAFTRDIKTLLLNISCETEITLVDDDGELVNVT